MVGSYIFNDVESSSFKLVCKSVKRPLLPALKPNRVAMLGSSGAYDFDSSEYALRLLTMRIVYIGETYSELRSRARQIAAWLSTKTWAKLIILDEPDKYYLARVTNEIELQSFLESGAADVSFDCQPFAYSVDEKTYIFNATENSEFQFENSATREITYKSPLGSKFTITITGSWSGDLNLLMNGKMLKFKDSGNNSELLIDNFNMTIEQDGVNKFHRLDGNIDTFFSVLPGDNILSINGTGLNVVITVNFIPLWI